VDHKLEKDLEKRTERKQNNKDEKKREGTRERGESKGTRIIHPVWFAAAGLILSITALLYWLFFLS
jgi:hypothetical protein